MTAGMWVGMLGCANGKAVVGTEQAVSKGRGKDRSVQYFPYCYPDNCPERFEGEPYVAFFSIGNCQYRVRYYKRPKSPCQSYCMIAIDRIDVLSPPPCDQTDIRELMDSAMTAAIRNLVGDRDYAGCSRKTMETVWIFGVLCAEYAGTRPNKAYRRACIPCGSHVAGAVLHGSVYASGAISTML